MFTAKIMISFSNKSTKSIFSRVVLLRDKAYLNETKDKSALFSNPEKLITEYWHQKRPWIIWRLIEKNMGQ